MSTTMHLLQLPCQALGIRDRYPVRCRQITNTCKTPLSQVHYVEVVTYLCTYQLVVRASEAGRVERQCVATESSEA
jgi:hypothetical protein